MNLTTLKAKILKAFDIIKQTPYTKEKRRYIKEAFEFMMWEKKHKEEDKCQ